MSDIMTFPDTVEEFMEQYKLVDTYHVYTNGTEMVPIFRMKQWFEHISAQSDVAREIATIIENEKDMRVIGERKRGKWKKAYADHEAFGIRPFYRYCSACCSTTVFPYNFCPECGADMRDPE